MQAPGHWMRPGAFVNNVRKGHQLSLFHCLSTSISVSFPICSSIHDLASVSSPQMVIQMVYCHVPQSLSSSLWTFETSQHGMRRGKKKWWICIHYAPKFGTRPRASELLKNETTENRTGHSNCKTNLEQTWLILTTLVTKQHASCKKYKNEKWTLT